MQEWCNIARDNVSCLLITPPLGGLFWLGGWLWDISILMMRTGIVLKTLVFYGHLTWLLTQEVFTEFSCHKSCKSYTPFIFGSHSEYIIQWVNECWKFHCMEHTNIMWSTVGVSKTSGQPGSSDVGIYLCHHSIYSTRNNSPKVGGCSRQLVMHLCMETFCQLCHNTAFSRRVNTVLVAALPRCWAVWW
jgi:hypothetical protein